MKIFVIGVAFAYNPFEIQNEIPDCFDQCGGIGGKCEEICGPRGYCCAPGNDYGDCSEMIRYGMSLIDPNIDTNEFKCIHYSSKYDCACSHPEYQLVELKSGHQCVRPFLGFYTFDEAQMICNFDRSSILAPNDLEDAEKFLDLTSNGNDIWLPFKYFDVENYDMGYWKNYKSDQMATFLQFAPRNPDLGRGKLLQINQYGQTVSTDDEDTGSFLCAHDPYFTLIPEPEIDTELLTVTENEFEEVLNDTIAENDGFVAPNYDYVTTLAPIKTVEDMDGDNFINARIRPFHDTDQSMYEDDSFGGDYNNQYGYIGDPFAQNNDADENYIY